MEDAWREKCPKRLVMEMSKVAHRLEEGVRCEDIISDWTPLLSNFEKNNLAKYESIWEKKHKLAADADTAAAFVLMQDAETHTTMVNKEACHQSPPCTHTSPPKQLWWLCLRMLSGDALKPHRFPFGRCEVAQTCPGWPLSNVYTHWNSSHLVIQIAAMAD